MKRIAIVLGTRPEIIKMSPVIRTCEKQGLDYFILHTGQHYTYNMDKVFFEQLELPEAKYNQDVGSGSHGEQTGKMLIGIEKILQKEKPDVVLVEGDTNTVLAGALAATKLHIKVGHVEAGLRSYDRRMPEEMNRVLTDHCSDYLFAPTEKSRQILLGGGIPDNKIFVTGNTIVDAVYQNLSISEERINPLNDLELIEPVDYLSFLQLEAKAKLVLTDSGGVQEESCTLNVPCVTLRDNTERPETLEVGSNILAGTNAKNILSKTKEMINRDNNWNNPFGDGKAGERIVEILMTKAF